MIKNNKDCDQSTDCVCLSIGFGFLPVHEPTCCELVSLCSPCHASNASWLRYLELNNRIVNG